MFLLYLFIGYALMSFVWSASSFAYLFIFERDDSSREEHLLVYAFIAVIPYIWPILVLTEIRGIHK